MNLSKSIRLWLFIFTLLGSQFAVAQRTDRKGRAEQCATMHRLEQLLERNAQLRTRFERQQSEFNQGIRQPGRQPGTGLRTSAEMVVPVVFHIILPNPNIVTDAQVQAQLDTLNRSFSGNNGDVSRVPTYFQSLFGKSTIQFCLAQRSPAGDETTGIVRSASTRGTFDTDDAVKRNAAGGVDSWDTDAYLNIWVTSLTNGVLGYATFPNDGSPVDQGVVIDYRSLPGGSFGTYNGGKTLVHEVGHYFNLYHIWGDDNNLCTGTDYVDDTPNQGGSSSGCTTGVRTDNCTTTGNGIMYQNYMDYSYDACLVMFTREQVVRMENALLLHRPSLLQSKGCQPVVRRAIDVQLNAINRPDQRLCNPEFEPVVTIRNRGSQTLTSVMIHAQIDGGPVTTTTWTGSLATSATAVVTLPGLVAPTGKHVLTVYTTRPNATTDEELSNDTLRLQFQYYPPVTSISESFERTEFPPVAWDVINPDRGITWQRVSGVAKTGLASAMINNLDYSAVGQKDDLRLPQVTIPATVDSAFFSFQVAAATYTEIATQNNVWDTLEVLISADCGQTYTSLYKKWGPNLVTKAIPVTVPFVPSSDEWRKDSINLAPYIGQDNLLIAFRNTTGYENNIYLDDVVLRTVTINPNLKKKGFLVTPNPTSGQIAVQFFPQPSDLRGLQIFSVNGQKLRELNISSGQANNLYTLDLSGFPAGIYFVRAVFTDRVVVEKILKF